ncbi:MAG: hypothetical protein LIO65_05650 [Odoribacter sp.]|nr:hypothetical protein [Odoribacter sp.]
MGTAVFSAVPDSVYVSSNKLLLLNYTDDKIFVKEISFDKRNKIKIEERLSTRYDSTGYLSKKLYGYNEFRLNVDCEKELLGKKIPVSYEFGFHDYTFFAPGRFATVRWELRREREYKDEHYTVSNAWKQESIGKLNLGVLYDLHSFFGRRNVI